MTDPWANDGNIESSATFDELHAGLTVGLIMTPRAHLVICREDDVVPAALGRSAERYDFLPVVAARSDGDAIVGLFHAEGARISPLQGLVSSHMTPLSESSLIGADTSILKFLEEADKKPARLVVSGSKVAGLVTLSDLQKLPVRATLFAIVTGFEMTLARLIRKRFLADADWSGFLSAGRKEKLLQEVEKSKKENGFVDAILFTQLSDKSDIIRKARLLPGTQTSLALRFKDIETLRNKLAHANEYAASPEEARKVCATVRDLAALRSGVVSLLA